MPTSVRGRKERDARRAQTHQAHIETMAPDDPAEDMDKFRNMLTRRIYMLLGARQRTWHGCPERICRRYRVCMAPRITCSHLPPAPPSTAEETARALAMVQRAIRQFGEWREAEE